ITVDVDAARIKPWLWNFEDQSLAADWRVVAALHTNEVTGELLGNAPHRRIYRTRDHAIEVVADHRVQLRIECSCGLASSASRTAAGLGGLSLTAWAARGRSPSGVALIQNVLNGYTAAGKLIPGPGDLPITVRIENLTAPADCS